MPLLHALILSLALPTVAAPESLREKEAIVWYMGHSGWAIQTKSRFLVFDYW